ncbi:tbp-1 interacting protein [Holotrichia oblita]|uniref:Tbp-1 interacting protein n=1 Tax=Holotrichia oblita TaxID=644536 RepID=A0ACB9TLK9_HOLOL|nr:tbp-1 interacting protein [Holotrichia oblita]
MATDEVLRFMQTQNRPFSANDVMQNVQKEHTKTTVQKALDKLVNENKLFEKIYGKQKVYCVVQEDVDTSNMEDDLKKMDREINEATTNLKAKEDELHKNLIELSSLQKKITTDEARRNVNDLKKEIEILKDKLDDYAESITNPISNEEKLKIIAEYERYWKEYRKRKRMCKDMLDTILEGYPKSKKHLFEEIGIETDEDVGFTLEEMKLKI